MELSRSDEQVALISGAEASSLIFILERGLNYIRQDRFVEGIALLTLAREQLSAEQECLTAALDGFIQGHTLYWQAQQALHQAAGALLTQRQWPGTRVQHRGRRRLFPGP